MFLLFIDLLVSNERTRPVGTVPTFVPYLKAWAKVGATLTRCVLAYAFFILNLSAFFNS